MIIPMAGVGKRMRPHTLTIPKPLLPIAGKPIVQRIVEDIADLCDEKIDKIGFIIGDFGKEVEDHLYKVAENVGAEGKIYYQEEALGPGHAVLCGSELLEGKAIVAFADTLFKADFKLETETDGIIWVHKVDDPSSFGVVKVNDNNVITDFVEKPENFVSDLAIIGIYYFKDGTALKSELNYIVENDIKEKGEYQLTTALEQLKNKGIKFVPGEVKEWLDCGNKDSTVYTNKRYLDFIKDKNLVADTVEQVNSVIIPPVYLGDQVKLENSVIGPYVSIGEKTKIKDSIIKNSIIQTETKVDGAILDNSMLGNFVNFEGKPSDVSIGDYNSLET